MWGRGRQILGAIGILVYLIEPTLVNCTETQNNTYDELGRLACVRANQTANWILGVSKGRPLDKCAWLISQPIMESQTFPVGCAAFQKAASASQRRLS